MSLAVVSTTRVSFPVGIFGSFSSPPCPQQLGPTQAFSPTYTEAVNAVYLSLLLTVKVRNVVPCPLLIFRHRDNTAFYLCVYIDTHLVIVDLFIGHVAFHNCKSIFSSITLICLRY
jgi:hypothetical protein